GRLVHGELDGGATAGAVDVDVAHRADRLVGHHHRRAVGEVGDVVEGGGRVQLAVAVRAAREDAEGERQGQGGGEDASEGAHVTNLPAGRRGAGRAGWCWAASTGSWWWSPSRSSRAAAGRAAMPAGRPGS